MVSEIHEYPSRNPNFPHNLDIHPSAIPISAQSRLQKDAPHFEAAFGSAAQEVAILQYVIAGRVWEASYAMTLYIDPPPNLDFDPPLFNASESESSRSISIVKLGSGSGLSRLHFLHFSIHRAIISSLLIYPRFVNYLKQI